MVALCNLIILLIALWIILLLGKYIIYFVYFLNGSMTFDQMTSYLDVTDPSTWFNFDIYGFSGVTSVILNTIIVFFVIAFLALLLFRQNLFSIRRPKDAYQRKNFTSFQNHFERKRASYRLQYNDKGEITRWTLECFFDWLFRPTLRLQNAIMAEYNRPLPEYWNLQKLHPHLISEPIDNLESWKYPDDNDSYYIERQTNDATGEIKEVTIDKYTGTIVSEKIIGITREKMQENEELAKGHKRLRKRPKSNRTKFTARGLIKVNSYSKDNLYAKTEEIAIRKTISLRPEDSIVLTEDSVATREPKD